MPSNFRRLTMIAAIAGATPAMAQSFQDIAAIEQRVIETLGAGIGEPGGPARPIDRRLRLSACPSALIVEPVALGAVTVRCQAIGWRIRVPVLAAAEGEATVEYDGGTAVESPMPTASVRRTRGETIVRRGDPVSLVVVTGGFTVSRQAVADQDGAAGDRIRVRTEPRSAPIVGQILADGRVAMTGFN